MLFVIIYLQADTIMRQEKNQNSNQKGYVNVISFKNNYHMTFLDYNSTNTVKICEDTIKKIRRL